MADRRRFVSSVPPRSRDRELHGKGWGRKGEKGEEREGTRCLPVPVDVEASSRTHLDSDEGGKKEKGSEQWEETQ